MVISKAKEHDREVRTNLLKTMQVCLSMYEKTQDQHWLDSAKFYGEHSKHFRSRIEKHDYSEEDALIARVDKLYKELKQLV